MTDLVANTRLIGRERETRALTELLDGIHGSGAAIIIRGEAAARLGERQKAMIDLLEQPGEIRYPRLDR